MTGATATDQDIWVSITEAAKVCDVHYVTMNLALKAAGFKSKKKGKCRLYLISDVISLEFRPRRRAGQPVMERVNATVTASRADENHAPRISGFDGFLADQWAA